MIRIGAGALIALFISASPQIARAGAVQAWAQCTGDDNTAAIAGCTELIDHGHLSKAELADAYYSRGLAYYNQANYDLAIADYTRAIEFDPKDADTYDNRGVAYNQKGEYDLAIADYTAAIKLKPEDSTSYGDRCAAYVHQRAYDLAIADCTTALKLNPANASVYIDRADAYTESGHPALALADLTMSLVLDPTSPDAYTARGIAYARMGNDDQAAADYAKAIEVDPKYAKAYYQRAGTEYAKGQYDLAVADYSRAIDLRANFSDAYVNRAYIYARTGKTDLAIADDTKAIDLQPQAAGFHLERARIYFLEKDYTNARADAEAELKITPDKPLPATYLLITIDVAEGKRADAIALARDLVAHYPGDDSTHVTLGLLLGCLYGGTAPCTADRPAALAELSQAIALHPTVYAYAMRSQARPLTDLAGRHADLDAALAIDPNSNVALMTRAALYLYEKDYTKGLADADAVLAKTPADPQALNLRAIILGQLKRYDEQMVTLNAELKLDPNNAAALNSLCWSRAVRNVELDKALDNCNAAIGLSPKANYYDSRALVFLRLGKLDDALADYTAALAKTPDLARSLYGRGLVKIRKGQVEDGKADIAKALSINPQAGDAFKDMGLTPDQPAGVAAKSDGR